MVQINHVYELQQEKLQKDVALSDFSGKYLFRIRNSFIRISSDLFGLIFRSLQEKNKIEDD